VVGTGGVPPREGKAGLVAESPPAEGILKRDGVCDAWVPPVAGLGACPNRGFEAPSAVVVGVVDSAGLAWPAEPNRPPLGADG
jgi:hypothetical protein